MNNNLKTGCGVRGCGICVNLDESLWLCPKCKDGELSTSITKEVISNYKKLKAGQVPQSEQNSQILKALFTIKKTSEDLNTMINNLETQIKTPHFAKGGHTQ